MKNKKYRNKLGCELSYWKSGISLRVFRISPNLTSTTTLHKNIFILSRCQTVWTMWTLANDKPVIPSVTFISWAMIIPFWIIGSLYPTCVTDRSINLSVKHTLSLHFVRYNYLLVSDQCKYTFEGLWYFLRGYRPSKTDHLILSFNIEISYSIQYIKVFHGCFTPLYSTLYITNNNIRIQ